MRSNQRLRRALRQTIINTVAGSSSAGQFQSQGYLEKGRPMAKATAKVPSKGKEDLSGWEKRVVNAAPLIQSLSRDAPTALSAAGPSALHRGRTHRHLGRFGSVDAGARLYLRAGENPCRNQLT